MPTLAEIDRQIAEFRHAYIFWTRKEIKALPEILSEGEHIKAVTSGMVNSRTWLAVCTDRRVIFLNRNMFIGLQQIQMPLDRVQSIDHEFTLFFGSIRVFDGINTFQLNLVLKSSILPFVKATEEAMYAARHEAVATPAAATADTASQLTKLAELKEKGYLTEEEFLVQKRKLLGT